MKQLHHRLRTTTVYVTHDQVEAMTLADKIVVMHDGVVEQVGVPLEVYDRPANVFVAGFIGSPAMNFLRGMLIEDGRAFRSDSGFVVRLDQAMSSALNRPVIAGIRPEHLVVHGDGQTVDVVVVEPTGATTQVNVRHGTEELVCEFRERVPARAGEKLRIAPVAGCVHLFDAQTGRRIEGPRRSSHEA
jgi:multiple sugar transport system ATP-binding protein